MNAKQRRVAQRKYIKEVAPKLLELRLLGGSKQLVGRLSAYTPNRAEAPQYNIEYLRSKPQ